MFPSLGYFENDKVFPYTKLPSVSLSASVARRTEPPYVGGRCSYSHLDLSTRSLVYWIFLRWYSLRSGFHPVSFLLHTFGLTSIPYNEGDLGPETVSLLGSDHVSATLLLLTHAEITPTHIQPSLSPHSRHKTYPLRPTLVQFLTDLPEFIWIRFLSMAQHYQGILNSSSNTNKPYLKENHLVSQILFLLHDVTYFHHTNNVL